MADYPIEAKGRKRKQEGLVDSAGEANKTVAVASSASSSLVASPSRKSFLPSSHYRLSGQKGPIVAVKFSPSGSLLCSSSLDNTIFVWSIGSSGLSHQSTIPLPKGYSPSIDFSPSSQYVLIATVNHSSIIWDLQHESEVRKLKNSSKGHTAAVNSISRMRAVGKHSEGNFPFLDGIVDENSLYNPLDPFSKRSQTSHTLMNFSEESFRSPLSSLISTCGDDGNLIVWDHRVGTSILTHHTDYPLLSCLFVDHCIYYGGIHSSIPCFDLMMQKVSYDLHPHRRRKDNDDGAVCHLNVHPNGKEIISNGMNGEVRLWDISEGAKGNREKNVFSRMTNSQPSLSSHSAKGPLKDNDNDLIQCAISHDGTYIACGSPVYDRTVWIWNTNEFSEKAKNPKGVNRLDGHSGAVVGMDFHPFQPILASGSWDKTIMVSEI